MANQEQNTNQTAITSVGAATAGGTANSAMPAIVGTAQPYSTVDIFDGGRLIGSAGVDMYGNWTFVPFNVVSNGVHQFTALAVDTSGVVGPMSAPVSVSVPAAASIVQVPPVIESVIDAVGQVQGNVPSGGTTDDTRPTISGTGIPGDTVYIYLANSSNYGGQPYGAGDTVVDASGHWSIRLNKGMPSGQNTITATQFAPGAAQSAASAAWVVMVDTSTPAPPVIIGLTDDSGHAIAYGSGTADAHPRISGLGRAGDIIKVYDNGTAIGWTTVGVDGKWSFMPAADLSNGAHRFTMVDVNPAGTPSASSVGFNLIIATGTPATPAAPNLTDDNANAIAAGSTTYVAHPHISGTGVAGDIIKVYDGSTMLGSTTVGSNGQWAFTSPNLLAGSHSFNVTETNAAGTSSEHSASTAFSINPMLGFPVIVSIVDSVGAIQGNIAQGGVTDDPRPVFHGTGVPGDVVTISGTGGGEIGVKTLGSVVIDASGQWTFQPATNLLNGDQSVIAIGKLMGTWYGVWNFSVDNGVPATPAAPTLTNDNGVVIWAGSTTADAHPHINGTGKAGDIITVYDGSTVLGSTTIGPNGQWSFTAGNLSVGAHSINVTETNQVGTASLHSASIGFTYSNLALPPVITNVMDAVGPVQGPIPNNGVTDDTHPTVSGTGKAGNTVVIFQNGSSCGSAIVDATGHWSVKISDALSDGVHAMMATQFASGQAQSAFSATWTITIDTTTPDSLAAPILTDDKANAIASGSTTYDAHPHISGTGVAGDIIKVYDGSTVLGSTKVGANGTWSFTPSTDLSTGTHSISVTETNAAGTSSAHSAATVFSVDPSMGIPAFTSVVDSVGPIQGNIAQGGVTDDSRPVFHGTGVPGDVVTVWDNYTIVLGSVVVNASGQWTFQPSANLADKSHYFNAVGKLVSGVSATWNFTVDTTVPLAPAAPTLTNDGGWMILPGTATADAHPHISGTGRAGDIIKVYDNGTVIGSTTVGSDSKWLFTPSTDLADGAHAITVVDVNLAGTPSAASVATSVVIMTGTPATPVAPVLSDDVFAPIAAGSTTYDAHPHISGTGVAGDIIKVYDGSTVLGSTKVGANGMWSFTPSTDLSLGAHSINVTETNAAGTVSAHSASTAFSINPALGVPAITAVWDSVGPIQGNITQGGVSDDPRPVFYGTGIAGDVVTVWDNYTIVLGSVLVNASGRWAFQPTWNLADKSHYFNAVGKLASGVSATWNFTVDTTVPLAPAAPTLTNDNGAMIWPGTATADAHPHISGTGRAGHIFMVYDNGTVIGSTTVGSDSKWSFTPSTDLSDGAHSIAVVDVNLAGTSSAASVAITVVIVTGTPATPVTPILADDLFNVIAAGSTTYDAHPHINGMGVAGDIIKVYDGSIVLGSTTVGSNGQWTFTPTYLSTGAHSINVTETNAAGTSSAHSTSVAFSIDPMVGRPVITSVVDSVGPIQGNIAQGGTTDDSRPMFHGTGVPGDVVMLQTWNSILGSVVVNASGQWSMQPSASLSNGTWSIVAYGKISNNWWGAFNFTVDTTSSPVVHATDPLQAALVGDVDQSASQAGHHTVVGEHDAFVGKLANGNETVDLNADPASYFKQSTAHIQGAGGNAVDTLHLTGDHQVLDLTSLTGNTAAAKISGIEVVDLGGQHNTLKLSLTDVLNLGETDLFQKDGKQQMMVQGKDGDTVDLSNSHIAGLADGEWAAHGTAVVGGVTYNVYEHSGAHTELLVQQGVQIVVH